MALAKIAMGTNFVGEEIAETGKTSVEFLHDMIEKDKRKQKMLGMRPGSKYWQGPKTRSSKIVNFNSFYETMSNRELLLQLK